MVSGETDQSALIKDIRQELPLYNLIWFYEDCIVISCKKKHAKAMVVLGEDF